MSSSERNQTDPRDTPDQADLANNEVPELFGMLFGGNAAAARASAGDRMLHWAAAFDDWRCIRKRTRSKPVVCRDRLAWVELLGLVKKPPWELDTSDVQAYVDHSLEGGMKPGRESVSPRTI